MNIYDWVCEFENELMGFFQEADEEDTGTLNKDQFADILEQHGPKFGSREDYLYVNHFQTYNYFPLPQFIV